MPKKRAFRRRRWRAWLTGALMLPILFASAPSASANLLKEAASTVDTITSSLPKAVPSSDPPVSVPLPTPPPVQIQVPTPPKVTVPNPSPPPAVRPPSASSPSAGAPTSSQPSGDVAGGVREVVDSVASEPTEVGAEAGALPGAIGKGSGDSSTASPGRGGALATSPVAGARQIESLREAPVRRWIAYVWPAVALGPVGDLITGLQAALAGAALPRISTPPIPGLVSGLTAGVVTSDPSPSAASDLSPADAPAISLPGAEDFPLLRLLVSVLAFMGLLGVAVRLELGSPYRWWPR
jgi:hypothetical protein